jgi:molybdopterin synthase sulfur carrier subunit
MQVAVRLSGELAAQMGRHRLSMTLSDDATVGELAELLRQEYPQSASLLNSAVPIITGKHVTQSEPLVNGQEVAFLLPIAGGRY